MKKNLRLFISYGRQPQKYVNAVFRIKNDLEQTGHHVWIDKEGLSSGTDWEHILEKALLNQEEVIFFMTNHAARRPDGFCLNEIAYAINQNKPITPVMMEEITPPLSICRLQWLDMTDLWDADDNIDENIYQEKLQELLDILSDKKKLGFEGRQRKLANLLEPENFDHNISRHTKSFVGRQWIYDSINEWLQNQSAPRVLWLTAQAGFGKSAITGNAAHKLPHVAGIFFCQYDSVTRRDPVVMLKTFAYHLSTQLPRYNELINNINYDEFNKYSRSPRDLFQRLLLEPLSAIEEPEENYVYVIDGLDEVRDQKWGIVHLINNEFDKLPCWLKILVTSRPEPELKRKISRVSMISMEADNINNLNDIKTLLFMQLPGLTKSQSDIILQKSEGNMLYVAEVISEVHKGRLSLNKPDQFPEGLVGIYGQYFERQFPDIEHYKNYQRKLFELITAAKEPLSIPLINDILQFDEYEMDEAIETVGSLLTIRDDKISFFHKSITEWLENKEKCGKNYYVSARKGHELLAKSYLEGNKDNYLLKWGFSHILSTNNIEEGVNLLTTRPSAYLTSAAFNLVHNIQFPTLEKEVDYFLEALYFKNAKIAFYVVIQMSTSMLQLGYLNEAKDLARKILPEEEFQQAILILNLKNAELKSDYDEIEKQLSALFSFPNLDEQLNGIGHYYLADRKRVITEQSAYNDFAKAAELINPDYFFDYSMDAASWQADQLCVMGDVNSSEKLLYKLLKKAKEKDSKAMTGTIYRFIGQIYQIKREYEKALEFFYHSLEDLKASKYYVKQSLTLNNIGQSYIYYEPSKAEEFILKSRKLAEEINYPREEGKTYYTEAELRIWLEDFRRGKELLETAKEKLNNIKYIDGTIYCDYLLAHLYFLSKNYLAAYKQARDTYQIYNTSKRYPTRQVELLKIIKATSIELGAPVDYEKVRPSLDSINFLEQYKFLEPMLAELR